MWDERAKAAIDRSRNGSTGSAIMAQLLAAANILETLSTIGVNCRAPQSLPRAEPGIHGLNR